MYKKFLNILSGGICGICVLFIIMLIISASSLIIGKDMYIENSLLTLINTSQGNSIHSSSITILIFFIIGCIISGTYSSPF